MPSGMLQRIVGSSSNPPTNLSLRNSAPEPMNHLCDLVWSQPRMPHSDPAFFEQEDDRAAGQPELLGQLPSCGTGFVGRHQRLDVGLVQAVPNPRTHRKTWFDPVWPFSGTERCRPFDPFRLFCLVRVTAQHLDH